MQSGAGGVRKELLSSLAGTVPLVDVLSDLPLPSPLPTVLERRAQGELPLSAGAAQVLSLSSSSFQDPALLAKISAALMAVDTSFLELKEGAQEVPSLSSSAPALVRALMTHSIPQPSIKLTKLDPSAQYTSPAKHEPLSIIQEPQRVPADSKRQVRGAGRERAAKSTAKKRLSSSSSDEARPQAKSSKSNDSSNLVVSIPRSKQPRKKESTPIIKTMRMTVSIPRAKLPTQHQQVPDLYQHPLPVGGTDGRGFVIGMDQVAPSFEKVTSEVHSHKKKKKRVHYKGDPALMASLKHVSSMLSVVFDQADNLGCDDVFDRSVISNILKDITMLKQHAVLHQLSVSKLVKLITIMDRHVLDTASVSINTPDGWEAEPRVWRELVKERILRSSEAALVILHIVTAPNMPKNVLLEESIDQVITLAHYQLEHSVYPQFDGVYRSQNRDSQVGTKQKRKVAAASMASAGKEVMPIYHKLTEVMETLVCLVENQPLTDSVVLKVSSLGIAPFFVENISVLQLSAVRLVRAVFAHYEKHRDLILEDIFASLARLPTTKRNLRSFKLSSGQSIQMVTALILQLIQCIVTPPLSTETSRAAPNMEEGSSSDQGNCPDVVTQMVLKYDEAMKTANIFLNTFLKKCASGKDEEDFRPLFENFVSDLLTTLNQPGWPAAEALLTLLAMLLIRLFGERSTEQSLRVMSLEHLGSIAARLRRDAAGCLEQQEHDQLVTILSLIMQSKLERKSPSPINLLSGMDAFSENSLHMQKALIAFLTKRSAQDPASALARDFYIGQWLHDVQTELERVMKGAAPAGGDLLALEEEEEGGAPVISAAVGVLQQAELKKEVLVSLVLPGGLLSVSYLEEVLSNESAAMVTRFLASARTLSKSFDVYLAKLLYVLNDSAVHVRTKAMKALSTIVAADPSLLSRPEMQLKVKVRLSDTSTLMREAAVDLVGRFLLSRPGLIDKYYDMLCDRTVDTGVSVRKRVIKIFRDVCVQQPDFPKVPEICLKMIRRISDEDGIKQLVTSVFKELWFSPPSSSSSSTAAEGGGGGREVMRKRVNTITSVVGKCGDCEWFELLFEQLLNTEDKAAVKSIEDISQSMTDCLVETLLELDEDQAVGACPSPRLENCICTLYLFCKVRPSLLLRHATTLHPYLSTKCRTEEDRKVVNFVVDILQQVVPLMPHPSEGFLVSLEEDLIKLILSQDQILILKSVECLSVLVTNVTHNLVLVKDCFHKFYNCLSHVKELYSSDPTHPSIPRLRSSLMRSAFTAGLFCQFFDIDAILPVSNPKELPLTQQIVQQLLLFAREMGESVQIKCASGLGYLVVRHPRVMLGEHVRQLYWDWLRGSVNKRGQVLRNLQLYLKHVEATLKVADNEWAQKGDKENLQEFGDCHSSASSEVAQAFLQPVLESFLHGDVAVRTIAVRVVLLMLRQGLVHPAQCVPYLIAMSSEQESPMKVKADQQLSEHTGRYGHFMQTQLNAGVRKSYELQKVLSPEGVRGCYGDGAATVSLLSHVYTLLRSNKQHRRAFLRSLLRHFEDYEKNPLSLLLYLADNLAYLPYSTLEEPLFVCHNIDMTLSVTGANILQQFKEAVGSTATTGDDEEDIHSLSQGGACSVDQLAGCCHASQGCLLLLLLKQYLKKLYALSDSKCQKYSPTEPNKAFEKAVSRRGGVGFEPAGAVMLSQSELLGARPAALSREECITQYLEFKRLMNKLDPFEGEDEASDQETAAAAVVAPPSPNQLLPPPPPNPAPSQPLPPPPDPVLQTPLPTTRRQRSQSRASSTGSSSTSSSRLLRKPGRTRPDTPSVGESKHKRRRKRCISTDSEDEDPDYK